MSPRDTGTGRVMEDMILPAMKRGNYQVTSRTKIGTRPGGRRHFVDMIAARPDGRVVLVEFKWQQTAGTAEQKVPYEVISMVHALEEGAGKYAAGYVVLGGDGWSLREFFTSSGLTKYLRTQKNVHVLDMESFIGRANRGEL